MILPFQQNVPMCPRCSALMFSRGQNGSLYYVCHDCKAIFKVIGTGKAEIELLATDEEETFGQNVQKQEDKKRISLWKKILMFFTS